jgi:8-oxo-dGTP diphosphatase
MIENYVLGFLFNIETNEVCLIRKTHPDWQRDRLCGLGGHVQVGESPMAAMVREFEEEAGPSIKWRKFALIYGSTYKLFCYTARVTNDATKKVHTKTDEVVWWYPINALPDDILANHKWLIPMANYHLDIMADIRHESATC